MATVTDKICPYCKEKLKEGDTIVECQKCKIPMSEEQIYCPKCGQKIGLEIDQNTLPAINNYNQSVTSKNQKSKTLPIITFVIVLVASIGGYSGYQYFAIQNKINGIETLLKSEEYFDATKECNALLDENRNDKVKKLLIKAEEGMKEQYKDNVRTFATIISSSGSGLESIGNKIRDNWYYYIEDNRSKYSSMDNAIESALLEKASEISKAENEKDTINNLYKDLRTKPIVDVEIGELKYCIREVYDCYTKFYQLVTTPYNTYYTNYSCSFDALDQELASKLSELTNLLEIKGGT